MSRSSPGDTLLIYNNNRNPLCGLIRLLFIKQAGSWRRVVCGMAALLKRFSNAFGTTIRRILFDFCRKNIDRDP